MKVYNSIDEFAAAGVQKTVVTTGTFDGVHLGHKKILTKVEKIAKNSGAEGVLLTFHPHPRIIIFGEDSELHLLSTQEEKKDLLEKAGVQHLIIHPFTKELSRVTALDYVKDILVQKLHTHTMVIGHDHRFGKNREGSIKDLKEWGPLYGFTIDEIEPFQINQQTISSTKIRKAIMAGDLQEANNFLGYTYFMNAKVVSGMRLGTELGYPTANLEVENKHKLIPCDGIYAVYVNVEGARSKEQGISYTALSQNSDLSLTTYPLPLFKGMMSIGMNPTIENKGRSMEVHIFDFKQDIYNKHLRISFYKKIRNEEKFETLADLKRQLDKDKETVLGLLP
jgi:riboflavin kinase/FMN adenylyltransferase